MGAAATNPDDTKGVDEGRSPALYAFSGILVSKIDAVKRHIE